MSGPAPIVLFAFARPDHTRRTLDALKANELAADSDLTVFADAPRSPEQQPRVKEVRNVVGAQTGFKSVTLVERTENYGLARNISEGVTEVCARAGRVIVVEDDIVTSRHFLRFMNAALDRYAGEPRVHHVSGWNYPIDPAGLGDAFLWRVMNCWGWATWHDRWKSFTRDPDQIVRTWSAERIRRFNLDGAHDFFAQIEANHRGTMRTWATFWYATILERDGLCLNPARSLVENIGQDGTGEHFGDARVLYANTKALSDKAEYAWPTELRENTLAVARVQEFYRRQRPPLVLRLLGRLKRALVHRRR
jgi:hypothetical protein